jgi:hypothetical protein
MYSSMNPRKDSDTGYIVAWRDMRKFEAGKLDGEMTYGEARKKAEELSAREPDKTYWAEKHITAGQAAG